MHIFKRSIRSLFWVQFTNIRTAEGFSPPISAADSSGGVRWLDNSIHKLDQSRAQSRVLYALCVTQTRSKRNHVGDSQLRRGSCCSAEKKEKVCWFENYILNRFKDVFSS